jgi:molybdenum cofactor sulfurtransferase
LYANTLIDAVAHDLKTNLFGNPHSASPSSTLSSHRVDGVRLAFLRYLNADPEHFDLVFTANATAAIKLVVDGFREHSFRYFYHKDAHTSLVGIRERAAANSRCFESDKEVDAWLDHGHVDAEDTVGLFAYPAQSNMSGYRPPFSWCERLRSSKHASHQKAYSLLDAASYLTTGCLDLSDPSKAPDFVSLSFYKIFGFPDLGALIVRKEAGHLLTTRKFFGGGTVDMVVSVGEAWHRMRQDSLHEILEDGTLPFHTIPAIQHALNVQQNLFGNASQIVEHVSSLSASLYMALNSLRHYNGRSVVMVYKEACATHGDAKTQGPIMAFNLRRSDGSWVGKSHFETLAIACNIQMRSGGVCNPGGIATMLELEPWKMRRNYCEGMRCGDDLDIIGGQPTGILRVSLGAMSTKRDVDTFVQFVEHFFVEKKHSAARSDQLVIEPTDQIVPIEGGPPISLPHSDGQSQEAEREAWSLFHNEWCVVDLDTLRPLPTPQEATEKLDLKLNSESGTFKISILESEEPTDSYFSVEISKPSKMQHGLLTPSELPGTIENMSQSRITIDLWDTPPERKDGIPACNGRIADPYQQSGIKDFFSSLAGVPSTLARYRPRSSMMTCRTCELTGCGVTLANKEELKLHYEEHARSFNEFGLQTTVRRNSACTRQSLPEPIAAAKDIKKRRTKWGFALGSRKVKT